MHCTASAFPTDWGSEFVRLPDNEQGFATIEHRGSFDLEAAACRRELHQYAVSLTRCQTEADDLVQETMFRAFKSWQTFTPGTRLVAWLHTILYRVFVNQYRSSRRIDASQEVDAPIANGRASASLVIDPLPRLSRRFLGETLLNAIDVLPPEHREAVQLADVEGFSGDEVAELLGVPVGTVKSRLHRARRRLRVSLRETAEDMGYGSATRRIPASAVSP